jgi:cysteinyl-tRNA synthetase
MALRVYNTLTRSKEEFAPRKQGRVDIYQCGVTPYDYTHIGHARQYVFWDTVRRYLKYRGWKVFCVQNVTDVDDKIISRAGAEGVEPEEISEEYHRDFLEVMDMLGVERPDVMPKVTQHIPEIIKLVEGLIEKGYAYEADGDVFFDVTSFPGYGKLSGRSIDDMMAGARIEINPKKRNTMDFALWKSAKPGEPSWDSPWGAGRPGWHIECSALALEYLGSGFDMHGGGDELVFPHHENEIAQSEAFTGQEPFAKYFVHHAMLNIDDVKMSKSLPPPGIVRMSTRKSQGLNNNVWLRSQQSSQDQEYNLSVLLSCRASSCPTLLLSGTSYAHLGRWGHKNPLTYKH